MAKVQVFLPEPPQEFSTDAFRQINLALETLQNQLNTTYQKEAKALDHCIYDKHFPFCEQNTYLYPSSEQKVRYTAPY